MPCKLHENQALVRLNEIQQLYRWNSPLSLYKLKKHILMNWIEYSGISFHQNEAMFSSILAEWTEFIYQVNGT